MADIKIITEAMLENVSSFTDAVKPGDYVDEKIVDNFLGCVPPATHRANLIQCGEPYSSDWDEEKQQYMATYFTFSFDGSLWKYCGTCFLGKTGHRGAGSVDTLVCRKKKR
ncbi:MAG: hypothetical protein FWE20_09975 [Defluviitaleaceae bacterium]|nr:hypothetical protein [Defluviitaleaceae bacterium]